ncbi:HNH endonuclease [candidate division WOR-3 bacterium]|nr:HNH endonuclease [candidate division WOR-3 bacterium]
MKEHFAGKRCDQAEIERIRSYFQRLGGMCCVYCGDTKPKQWRWDHVHPVSKGGRTVIGNLVPACSSCDDSKQEKTLDEWFRRRPKGCPDPSRHAAIKRLTASYMRRFRYRPVDFPDGLTPKQKRVWNAFCRRHDALRAFLESEGIATGRRR